MDQRTARQLAAQVGGVATQDSRLHGRWPKAGEPWVVAVGHLVLREVPGT